MNLSAEASSSSRTARVVRVHRLGTRRLTRAHLALQQRAGTVAQLSLAADVVAGALSRQLGCPVTIRAHLVDATFRLERALGATQAHALLSLDAGAALAVLELDRPVQLAAVGRMSGGALKPAPSTKLSRIEEAAFGFLCLVGLDAARGCEPLERLFLPRLLGANVSRGDVLTAIDGRVAHLAVHLELEVAGERGQGRLFLPARAVQSRLQSEPLGVPGDLAPELLAASIQLRAFAGRAALDTSDLAALEPGDVVLFDGLSLAEGRLQGDGRLASTGFSVFGAFGADGFHVSRAIPRGLPQESPMSHPAPPDDAASLPVEVEIELTRLRLTVAELATVRPGAILPLHINSAEPVLLKVGDRFVARAELVEIEGEVGARILSLLS